MGTFVKKPIAIEAVRWDGVVLVGGCPEWLTIVVDSGSVPCNTVDTGCVVECGDKLLVGTLEGTMTACPGDWIIKGVKGELYPCKPDIFAESYDPLESSDLHADPMRDEGDALVDNDPSVGCGQPDTSSSAGTYWEGYREGKEDAGRFFAQRIDLLSLAIKGREGWGSRDIIRVARELEDYVLGIRNVQVKTQPKRETAQVRGEEREVDEFGHPNGTVFIPPVADELVEHSLAEPPAPVAGDARVKCAHENTATATTGDGSTRVESCLDCGDQLSIEHASTDKADALDTDDRLRSSDELTSGNAHG